MFTTEWSTPCDVQGTIVFNSFPQLGLNRDNSGEIWDIHAIVGTEKGMMVQAAKSNTLRPYYKSTSGDTYSYVYQKWLPYKLVIR